MLGRDQLSFVCQPRSTTKLIILFYLFLQSSSLKSHDYLRNGESSSSSTTKDIHRYFLNVVYKLNGSRVTSIEFALQGKEIIED